LFRFTRLFRGIRRSSLILYSLDKAEALLGVFDEFNSSIRLMDYSRAFSILKKFEAEVSSIPKIDSLLGGSRQDNDCDSEISSDLAQVWKIVVSKQFEMRDTLGTILPHIFESTVSITTTPESYSLDLDRADGSLDAVISSLNCVPLIDLVKYMDSVCKMIVVQLLIPIIFNAGAKKVTESEGSLLSIERVSGPSKWTLDSVIGLLYT
jgi:hypothetical protein